MNQSFVESIVRKLNRKVLFFSLAGLLIVVIGLALNVRYLANMVLGATRIAKADVLALSNPSSLFRNFVEVEGDDHGDTGYTYVSVSDSGKETVDTYYHFLLLDDMMLLVESDKPEIGNTVKGALVDIPSETRTEVVTSLEEEYPDIEGAFLPMMLDATNFYTDGLAGLGLAAVLGGVSLWSLSVALSRLSNPELHPVMKSLGRFGVISQVRDEIDMEIASEHPQIGKKVHFTRKWLISAVNSLDAVRYQDILWCYKQVTQHRTNGIPTGKTYAATVADCHGKMIAITAKEAEVDQILSTILNTVPGVVTGYSDELRELWEKNREEFIAAVDKRRRSGELQQ